VLLKRLHVLVFIEHGTRRLHLAGVTARPNGAWAVMHYNGRRPHRSRNQRPPDIETQPLLNATSLRSVRRKPVVAEPINEYHHAA